MAFSSALVQQDIIGSKIRCAVFSWNAASVTTGTISVPFGHITHISHNNQVTEDLGLWTSSGQTVTVTGVTSNDTGTVMVYGY